MSKNLLNYEGLEYFLSKLLTYIENQRTVKNVDTTASNGINLSNTNGTLDVTVTPGSVADGDTGLVTGDAVYDAINNVSPFIVNITGTSSSMTADKSVSEIAEAVGDNRVVFAIHKLNSTDSVIYTILQILATPSIVIIYLQLTPHVSVDYGPSTEISILKDRGRVTVLKLLGYTVTSDTIDLAPLNSPSLTGTPTAPTPTAGDDSTKIATTAFVQDVADTKEDVSNKVTSLSSSSTDTLYPSAKAVHDAIDVVDLYVVSVNFTSSVGAANKTATEVITAAVSGKEVVAREFKSAYGVEYRLTYYAVNISNVGDCVVYSLLSEGPITSNYTTSLPKIKHWIHVGNSIYPYYEEIALINSPTFTGTPKAPTPVTSDNSTRIATTAFVNNAINANAPYIIESTNGVAEKSVTEIASLYYGGTTNLALRYNGRLYPFITFFDSNSMGWGGLISQTNFGTNTQILTVVLVDTTLSSKALQVNIVKSVDTTASTSGINLSLNNLGKLDVSISSGSIASGNSNFVTGGTVYNTTNLLAPKASPALTGTPTAPTADLGTNNTQIATTAFVAQTVANALIGKAAFQGTVDSLSDIPNVYKKGYHWLVLTAGTYFTQVCEVGDIIYCVADSDATHEASWSIEKDFTVILNNLDIAIISNAEIDDLFTTESSDDSSNNG